MLSLSFHWKGQWGGDQLSKEAGKVRASSEGMVAGQGQRQATSDLQGSIGKGGLLVGQGQVRQGQVRARQVLLVFASSHAVITVTR